jgi:hypothetical protein
MNCNHIGISIFLMPGGYTIVGIFAISDAIVERATKNYSTAKEDDDFLRIVFIHKYQATSKVVFLFDP